MSKIIVLFGVVAGVLAGQDTRPAPAAPKQAKFGVRNELKVIVPPDAKKIRIWFAYPREDANQTIAMARVDTAGLPHRLEKDADGNTFLYVEAVEPKEKELLIIEGFQITRREQLTQPDAAKTRPLTPEETAEHKKDLAANTNVVIDEDVQKLAAEITKGREEPREGGEAHLRLGARQRGLLGEGPAPRRRLRRSAAPSTASKRGPGTAPTSTRSGRRSRGRAASRRGWSTVRSSRPTSTGRTRTRATTAGPSSSRRESAGSRTTSPWPTSSPAEFPLNADNTEKVKLTTADGYTGPDPAKVDVVLRQPRRHGA